MTITSLPSATAKSGKSFWQCQMARPMIWFIGAVVLLVAAIHVGGHF